MSEDNAGVLGQGAVYTVCTILSSSSSILHPSTVPWWLLSGALWLTSWSSLPHCSMLMLVGALSWAPAAHASPCHLLSLSPLPCTVIAQTLYSCGHLSSHCISSFASWYTALTFSITHSLFTQHLLQHSFCTSWPLKTGLTCCPEMSLAY